MNRHQIRGKWQEFKGRVRTAWGRLTHYRMQSLAGKRDTLAGKIQEKYGTAKAAAKKQVKRWRKRF
jgi:uncharacterized protein YjbJ (UPF0337 family)